MDLSQGNDTDMAPCVSQDSDSNPIQTESILEKKPFQTCSKLCIVYFIT